MGFAAGFSKGFGDSFASSYELGTRIRKQEEADMFDKIWTTYERNREKREEAERNDSQIAGAAKQIASRYGQPVAPIMDALKSGLSVEYVDGMAKSGNWRASDGDGLNPTQTPESPEVTQTQQVQEEGEGPGIAQREAPTSSAPPGIPQNAAYRQSLGRAAAAAGVSADEFQQGLTYQAPVRQASTGGYEYLPNPQAIDLDERQQQLIAERSQPGQSPERIQEIDAQLASIGQGRQLASGRTDDAPATLEQIAYKRAVAEQAGDAPGVAAADNALRVLRQQQLIIAGFQGGNTNMFVKDQNGETVPVRVIQDVDGNRSYVGLDNQPVQPVREVTPDEAKSEDDILNAMSTEKPVQDYNNQLPQVASYLKLSSDLATIVEQYPQVATTAYNAGEYLNRLTQEAGGVLELVDRQLNSNSYNIGSVFNSGNIDTAMLTAAEQEVDSLLSNGVRDAAEAKALFDAKRALLVYRLGMANEQSGRAFTDVDRQQFMNILSASVDDQAFLKNLATLARDTVYDMDNKGLVINSDNRIQRHQQRYGSIPFSVPTIQEFLTQSNEVAGGQGTPPFLDFIGRYASAETRDPTVDRPEVNPNTQSAPLSGTTRSGISWSIE